MSLKENTQTQFKNVKSRSGCHKLHVTTTTCSKHSYEMIWMVRNIQQCMKLKNMNDQKSKTGYGVYACFRRRWARKIIHYHPTEIQEIFLMIGLGCKCLEFLL